MHRGEVPRLGRETNQPHPPVVAPRDGRAEMVSLETLGAYGQPTMIWQSGENVTVRVDGPLPRARWKIR